MDLAVYGRVLWRFRFVVALGTICALLVAILAMAHVSFSSGRPTFRYRSHELWTSQSTLLVTQRRGFPEGRLTLPQNSDPAAPPLPGQQTFADPSRLVFLASLYAQFAKADAIDAIVRPRAGEKVLAAPVNDTSSGSSVGSRYRWSRSRAWPRRPSALCRSPVSPPRRSATTSTDGRATPASRSATASCCGSSAGPARPSSSRRGARRRQSSPSSSCSCWPRSGSFRAREPAQVAQGGDGGADDGGHSFRRLRQGGQC